MQSNKEQGGDDSIPALFMFRCVYSGRASGSEIHRIGREVGSVNAHERDHDIIHVRGIPVAICIEDRSESGTKLGGHRPQIAARGAIATVTGR